MERRLDPTKPLVTMNGRPLRVVTKTIDGGTVVAGIKSKSMVIIDEFGRVDGRQYAVHREDLKPRFQAGPNAYPAVEMGQSVFCFRFSRRGSSLFRATYAGVTKQRLLKLVPERAAAGRELVKAPRAQVFESVAELDKWKAQLDADVEALTVTL